MLLRSTLWAAVLFLLGAFCGTGPSAQAQTAPSASTMEERGHQHTYARPGHATHTVYIWGAVKQPGVWKIEPNTGLVELFSVVHPNGFGVETAGTEQDVLLRIHRSNGGQSRVVHEMKLDELLSMAPSRRPLLQADDVLEVRTVEKRKFSFATVSSVIGTLSSLVLLGLRIFRR